MVRRAALEGRAPRFGAARAEPHRHDGRELTQPKLYDMVIGESADSVVFPHFPAVGTVRFSTASPKMPFLADGRKDINQSLRRGGVHTDVHIAFIDCCTRVQC